MLYDLCGLKNELSEQGIFFCFSGPVSQKLVTEIGAILGQKMTMEKASKSTVLRVFALVVEKAQNIIHYSDEKFRHDHVEHMKSELRFGIIAVGYKDGHYFVLSGNMIENHKVSRLREKLTTIQNMSKQELKRYYLEQRRKRPGKGSKGAGLGFLEMAQKANCPMEFEFKMIDAAMSFFSIKTTI